MTQTIKLPDGTRLQFPDGMSQQDMAAAIAKAYPQFAPPKPAEAQAGTPGGWRNAQPPADMFMDPTTGQMTSPSLLAAHMPQNTGDAGMIGSVNGLTMGAAPYIFGGVPAAISGMLGGKDTFEAGTGRAKAALLAAKNQHPYVETAAEIGGAVTSPATKAIGALVGKALPAVMPMANAAGKATMAGRVADSAAQGALGGGLYGFNAADGSLADHAREAAKGAMVGGSVGTGLPFALAGIGKAVDATIGGPIASLLPWASPVRASKAVQAAVQRSGMTPDDIAARIAAANAEGQAGYTVADAMGNAGQRMLSGMARTPGDARQGAVDFLTQRQSNQGDRVSGFLADALGAQKTAQQTQSGMKAARDAAANVQYDAARNGAEAVDVRGAISAIDNRIGPMAGSGVSGDGIDGRLGYYRSRLAASDPNATKFAPASAVELSDFTRVLNVKKDITDEIGAAVRAGKNNLARELGAVKDQLDAALEASSGGYRTANDNFAKASGIMDAVDTGAGMASGRVRSADALASFARMSKEQQAAARVGLGDQLIGKVEASAEGVNKVRPLTSDKYTTQLNAMAMNPDMLGRQIAREKTMFETANAALGGSKTADNLADSKDVTALSAPMIMNLITGRWGAASSQAMQGLLNKSAGRNEATKALIIKALLGQDVNGALRPAIEAAKNTPAKDLISSLIRNGSVVASAQ